MPKYVSGKKKFTPAPEGLWPGVCVDMVELGLVESAKYEPREMVEIRWVLDAEPPLPGGKPHMAARKFGRSIGKKSLLRPFLEAWRGKKFTNEELKQFDLEALVGACGQIQIIHREWEGDTYGNVQAVVPYPRGLKKMEVPADYVRQEERNRREELEKHPDGNTGNGFDEYHAADEDIPF